MMLPRARRRHDYYCGVESIDRVGISCFGKSCSKAPNRRPKKRKIKNPETDREIIYRTEGRKKGRKT